jgi:hypothetical protein
LVWAAKHGVAIDRNTVDVGLGDALEAPNLTGKPVVVVGNPPFASPLRRGSIPEPAERYRAARSDRLGPYADLAATHLLKVVERVPEGSIVALIQPQSVLSGRDGDLLRRHLAARAPLRALWAARESVFDAGVRACAVVVEVGGTTGGPVVVAAGASAKPVGSVETDGLGDGSWADLAAHALGAPDLPPRLRTLPAEVAANDATPGRLGDLVTATAGFRDEFYGLVAACREGAPVTVGPRLLTVGLVDPLDELWGRTPCRFGGRQWKRPVIDVAAIESDRVRAWTEQRLRPKLVLATQSPVLEPVIDRDGSVIPATPLLSIEAAGHDLDRVAAVLLAPPVAAWAWRRWFGSALAVDALKLAARQVEQLPLPDDAEAWAEAAALLESNSQDRVQGSRPASTTSPAIDGTDGSDRHPEELVIAVAAIMNRAYDADDAVFEWWLARYRKLRRRRSGP